MYELLNIICNAVWFILPAYVANATPVVLGGGFPVDFNKKMPDGNRILGDGKTVRGLVAGLLGGTLIGFIQSFYWGRPGGWEVAVLLSVGALFGDLIGSFVKRRCGLARGEPMPVLDQLEFIVFALLVGSLRMFPGWDKVTVLLLLTPLIHIGTNVLGYKAGLKSEPY